MGDEGPTKPLSPRVLVRADGAAVLALAIYLYSEYGRGWLLFLALILAPDLSIAAYLVNRDVGASLYNLVHTYV